MKGQYNYTLRRSPRVRGIGYVFSFMSSLILLALLLFPSHSLGVISFGEDEQFELEGYLNIQNVLRTPQFDSMELIMQRNTLQLEGKYYLVREGATSGGFTTGPIEGVTLTVIGRAIYDSIYDVRDSYEEAFRSSDGSHGKYGYKIREAFLDIILPPFTLRLGRQQVVWGETDNFRALDVINPLDLSWHWSRESWEDIRIPLWMARAVYDIGKFGPLEESFLEVVWIPRDFKANKLTVDPRRPWAATGAGLSEVANSIIQDGQIFDLEMTVRNRAPKRKISNGQGGLRFKAIWRNIDFSLNYFYGFSADTGFKFRNDLSSTVENTKHFVFDAVNPRSHVLGMTANYSEEKYTQSVLRLETTFTTGVPVEVAAGAPLQADSEQDQFETARRMVVMLGVDRPTWIRSLNSFRTFFISAQIFWRHYLDYSSHYRGIPSVLPAMLDGSVVPDKFIADHGRDKIDRNEFVFTFAASTSYGAAGLIKPQFVFVIDPRSTGAYNRFAVDYIWSDNIVFRLQQDIYWRLRGNDTGPWALGDIWGHDNNNSRHETIFSVVVQF